MARIMNCTCGLTLTAQDDRELLCLVREHIDQVHPELQLTDEQVRGILGATTKDGYGAPARPRKELRP